MYALFWVLQLAVVVVAMVVGAVGWPVVRRYLSSGFVWDGEVPDPVWHAFDEWNDRARAAGDRVYERLRIEQEAWIDAAGGQPRHAASDRTQQLPIVDVQELEPAR